MSSFNWPAEGGGSGNGVPAYSTLSAFPPGSNPGDLAVAIDTGNLYEWNGTSWVQIAGPGGALSLGAFGSTPNADGLTLSGGVLNMEPADATHPGGVSTTTQTIAGDKTFSGMISAANLSGQNSGDAQVIWQPGGVQAGNVYTTWAAVYAAISPLGVAAIDVCCDSTFSSTFTITAGTYALGNTTIQGPVGQAPSNPTVVTIANGVTFTSFPVVSQLVNLVSASSSTVFTVGTGTVYFIDLLRGAILSSVSGAPMITVATGGTLFIALEALTSMSGAPGFPVVNLVGTGGLFVLVAEGAALGSDCIGGGASSSVSCIVANPSAAFSNTQSDLSGTFGVSYNPLITNITVGSGLGDTVYSNATGQGVALPANITTSKLFLSETGTGSAGNAPVWSAISSGDLPTGNLTDAGTDGITVTGGTGAVIGSGTSIAQHVADASHNGYLASADWTTFNNKQAGPLTGDVTTVGAAATLATVATPGTSTKVTYNAKGLVTSGTQAVLASSDFANQGTTTTVLHGNASGNPSFGAVSLTTDVSGTLPIGSGGTGQATANPAFNALSPLTTKGDMLSYSTVNARIAVPGDYGDLVADSTTATGWRAASYVQTNGRPGKNYIQYADFENNSTTGWTLGTIGTLTNGLPTGSPTFGSGASGNLSLAIASSSQLSGAYSLSYVSSAATTAGNMVASSSYAIDPSSQAKVLQISFAYNIFSGAANANFSGTSSNSYAWAIWDVTNSSWLTSAGNFNLVQNSGVGICTGTCQTNATTASIRLVVYNANATSGAATMYFDDFFVGPQIVQKGPAMSDFTPFTMTIGATTTPPTKGTTTLDQATWRRVGDSMEIVWNYVQTSGGSNGSGDYLFNLPSGYSIDTSKLTVNNSTSSPNVGWAFFNNSSDPNNVGIAVAFSSTQFKLVFGFTTPIPWGSGHVAFNGAVSATMHAFVPIAGWSSNSVQSSDTDTRLVAMDAVKSAGSVTANTTIPTWTVVNQDTHGAFNSSTGVYTIPVSGDYMVSGNAATTSGTPTVAVIKNGSVIAVGSGNSSNTGSITKVITGLVAGDQISVCLTSTLTIFTGTPYQTFFSINRLSGPAVITATDSVNARYFASSTSLSGSLATINWTTKDFDSANGMSSGTYTVPVTGKYQVNSAILVSGTVALNSTLIMEIQKNGTVVSRYTEYAGGVETNLKGIITDIISCLAGDTLRIQVSTSASGPAIVSSNFDNYMSLSRVGN